MLEVEELMALHLDNELMRARLDLVSSGRLSLEQVLELLKEERPAISSEIDLTAIEDSMADDD